MAPNTSIDFSQDILFFRQLITDALSRKLFYFDNAYIPLYRLLKDVPETQGSKKSKVRKSYSPKEAAAQFSEYRDIIRTFLQYADTDREYVKEFFVWRACLQFAVIKKGIANFLAESYWCDRALTRSYLSDISNRMSSLSVLNAVCDNPFLNRKDFQLGQAAALIEEFKKICGKGWNLTAETSLQVQQDVVRRAAAVIGDFIVDVKDSNPDIYRAYTGGDAKVAWDNLKLLLELKGAEHVIVRVPQIPDYNTEADTDRTAARLAEMGVTNIDRFTYKVKN